MIFPPFPGWNPTKPRAPRKNPIRDCSSDVSRSDMSAVERNRRNLDRLWNEQSLTRNVLYKLFKKQMGCYKQFETFSELMKKINGRQCVIKPNIINVSFYVGLPRWFSLKPVKVSTSDSNVFDRISDFLDLFSDDSKSSSEQNAWQNMMDNEIKIDKICDYWSKLRYAVREYMEYICSIERRYQLQLVRMQVIAMRSSSNCSWQSLSEKDKLAVNMAMMLVKVLTAMSKVKLTKRSETSSEITELNDAELNKCIERAKYAMTKFDEYDLRL